MKRTAALICGVATACAMDFTPHPSANVQSFLRVFFLEGKTRYAVNLPPGTTMTGGPVKALFFFTNLESASFSMGVSPVAADVPFDEPGLEKYRKAALTLAGPAAAAVAIRKEENEPLSVNGWTSYRFTVAFELPGRRFLQRVTFLNATPKEQWVLITTASEKTFDEADARSVIMFRSLRKLTSDEDLFAPVYP